MLCLWMKSWNASVEVARGASEIMSCLSFGSGGLFGFHPSAFSGQRAPIECHSARSEESSPLTIHSRRRFHLPETSAGQPCSLNQGLELAPGDFPMAHARAEAAV